MYIYNYAGIPTHLTHNTKEYKKVIDKVTNILNENKVIYTTRRLYEGYQILFNPWHQGDVIIHDGSYGHNIGKVETMGFPWDEGDVSMLSPEECANEIVELFESYKHMPDWDLCVEGKFVSPRELSKLEHKYEVEGAII